MMRQIIKNIPYLLLAFVLFMIVSCEKDDNKKDWGIAKIYMPQAAIVSGGTNSNYPVPWSSGNGIENYIIDSIQDNINIILGVYRSGLEDLKGYSVKITTDADTVQQLIGDGTLSGAVPLPADAYSLPDNISVPDGQREKTFYLTVSRKTLVDKYASYKGKQLVLAVKITDPSSYELNPSLSTTIVIIDSKAFMP